MRERHLAPAFDHFFNTWTGSGEQRWAEHAWTFVRDPQLDLTKRSDQLADLLRLLSLGALTREFHVYTYGEDVVGEWTEGLAWPVEAAGLLGELNVPEVEDPLEDPEFVSEVLLLNVTEQAKTTAERLRTAFGNHLFAYLCESTVPDARYPLDDESLDRHLGAVDFATMPGFEWIEEGMPL